MQFFLRKRHFEKPTERFLKRWKLLQKCGALLLVPIVPTALVWTFWFFVCFRRDWHFNEKMEVIVTAAWIPTFGLMYCLLVTVVFATVWGEYKNIRLAVKRYDVDTFMDLRDEELSPLAHLLVFIFSVAVLGGFMSLQYPRWECGTVVISSITYIFVLVFVIVKEMDDPCAGIWFIRHIPPEWLEIDPKMWRQQRRKKAEAEFRKAVVELQPPRVPEESVPTAEPAAAEKT